MPPRTPIRWIPMLAVATMLVIVPAASFAKDSKAKSGKEASQAKLVIDSIKRDDYINTACGCAYYAPTRKREDGPMYMWINQRGEATMKVNGQMRQLRVASEERVRVNSKQDEAKIGAGDKVLMVLRSDPLSASVTQTAERNCKIGTDCSLIRWQATLTLSEKDVRKSINAWSVCGCPGRKILKAEEERSEAS